MQPGTSQAGQNNEKPVCNICAKAHNTERCQARLNMQLISDTPLLSKARQSLPHNLEITKMADGCLSVRTKQEFARGSTFGPFEAKRSWTMNPETNFPIRIFGSSPADTYHLDYSSEESSNWMCFILPATCEKEQNLICYQLNNDIFYTAIRTIPSGEELRVWYAPYYAQKMNLPNWRSYNIFAGLPASSNIRNNGNSIKATDKAPVPSASSAHELAERLSPKQLGAKDNKDKWPCKLCSKIYPSVPDYAKHLIEHYKSSGKCTVCNVCNRKFNNFTALQRHKAEEHPGNVIANSIIRNVNGQVIGFNISVKNVASSENLDAHKLEQGANLLIGNSIDVHNSVVNSLVPESTTSQNQVEFKSQSLDSAVVDQKSGEISEKDVSYDCDICDKPFDRPAYLLRHLRKHTGEFLCQTCKTVFARRENLTSHLCPSGKETTGYPCPYCLKSFNLLKNLNRHLKTHEIVTRCRWCTQVFASKNEIDEHNCQAEKHICPQCNKRLVSHTQLKKHLQQHNQPKLPFKKIRKKSKAGQLICEICGESFKTSYILKQHQAKHGDRRFECRKCRRTFHRLSVFKDHVSTHEPARIPCRICGKKVKSKNALKVHMLMHGVKKYHCTICNVRFYQKCNYLKHHKQVHNKKIIHKCNTCSAEFTSKEILDTHVAEHSELYNFQCQLCTKWFFEKQQLNKHVKTNHSGYVYKCCWCSSVCKYRNSISRHLTKNHQDKRKEWHKPGFISKMKKMINNVECITSHSNSKSNGANSVKSTKTPDNSGESLNEVKNNCDKLKQPSENPQHSNTHSASNISGNFEIPTNFGDISTSTNGVRNSEVFGNVENIQNSTNQVIPEIIITLENDPSTSTISSGLVGNNNPMGHQQILMEVPNGVQNEGVIGDINVPQLSISVDDVHLEGSVLNSACIFGEDGFTFYVFAPDQQIAEF